MLAEIPQEELASAVDYVAGAALAAADAAQPPIDALRVAARLGLTIAWDDRQAGRARRVTLAAAGREIRSILVRRDPRPERRQWAVAHEIGEALAEKTFAELGVDPREAPRSSRESLASAIASALLLPQEAFRKDGVALGWDLLALKQRYCTASHELIARRMLDCQVPICISVYDQNRLNWRKNNVPGQRTKPTKLEMQAQGHTHETGEPVVEDGPPMIQVWPVHEPLWQREIVRVQIDELASD